jgi:prepilin peptidase CpaA
MATYRIEHLVLLGVLLAIAASTDLAARRVPNSIPVVLVLSGLAIQVSSLGWRAAASSAAVALACGALLLGAWSMRLVGGGDLKLAVAVAAWMGTGRIVAFVLATALVAGALAVPFLRSFARARRELLVAAAEARVGIGGGAPRSRERTVPFAVAVALGAAVALGVR